MKLEPTIDNLSMVQTLAQTVTIHNQLSPGSRAKGVKMTAREFFEKYSKDNGTMKDIVLIDSTSRGRERLILSEKSGILVFSL